MSNGRGAAERGPGTPNAEASTAEVAARTPDLAEAALKLRAGVRLLLWDYPRGSLAYDLALLVVSTIVLLVPGAFWGDPLWSR